MPKGRAVVVAIAIAAALVSTYPLLLGRSVASPMLGGVAMLYRDWPYTPGNDATTLENPRAIDMLAPLMEAVPYLSLQRAALHHGEWPHWNRYSALGTPLHGQGQPSLLDPLHLLALAPSNPAAGLDLKIVVGRVMFAIGAGLLGLAVAGGRGGVTLAVIAPFIGLFIERLAHPAQFSVVYLPWLLLGYVGLLRQTPWGSTRHLTLILFATAFTLAGSPVKEAAAQLVVVHAVGALTLILAMRRRALKSLAVIAVGLALVACLTAPHWLIFLDTLTRAQTLYDQSSITFAGWNQVLGLVLGPVMPGTPTASLNVVAMILVLAGAAPLASRVPPAIAAAAAMCVIVLALGLGALPQEWLLAVPGVGRLQRIGSLAFTACLVPLLMLAAHGAETIHHRLRIAISAALVLIACAIASWQLRALLAISPAMAMFAASTLMIAPMLLLIAGARSRVVGMLATVGLAVLVLLPGGLHWRTGVDPLDRLLMQPPPRPNFLAASRAVERWRASSSEPSRVVGIDGLLRGGAQALYRVEGVLEQDALVLPGLNQLMQALPVEWHRNSWDRRVRSDEMRAFEPILNMLGVGALLLPPESTSGEATSAEPMRLLHRSSPWPRAFFTSAVATHVDADDFVRKLNAAAGPLASIHADDSDARQHAASLMGATATTVTASDYRLEPNRTMFRIATTGTGVAVLTESWVAHDFVVRLNGQPVPYFRVNEIAKAILIPNAGHWEVSFEYRPRLWALSWGLAVVGAVGVGLLVANGKKVLRPTNIDSTVGQRER